MIKETLTQYRTEGNEYIIAKKGDTYSIMYGKTTGMSINELVNLKELISEIVILECDVAKEPEQLKLPIEEVILEETKKKKPNPRFKTWPENVPNPIG